MADMIFIPPRTEADLARLRDTTLADVAANFQRLLDEYRIAVIDDERSLSWQRKEARKEMHEAEAAVISAFMENRA